LTENTPSIKELDSQEALNAEKLASIMEEEDLFSVQKMIDFQIGLNSLLQHHNNNLQKQSNL